VTGPEFLRDLAKRIEDGQAPMLELSGEAKITVSRLLATAKALEAQRTVSEMVAADDGPAPIPREGWAAENTVAWTFDPEEPTEVVYTFGGHKACSAHLSVGWCPGSMVHWMTNRVATVIALAYAYGRSDAQREIKNAVSKAAELIGVKAWT